MALGHCSHEHYPVLFEELPGLVEEYQRTKQRRGTAARPEEVSKPTQRTAAAHVVLSIPACLAAVCRLLARVPPGPSKAGWCDRSFESNHRWLCSPVCRLAAADTQECGQRDAVAGRHHAPRHADYTAGDACPLPGVDQRHCDVPAAAATLWGGFLGSVAGVQLLQPPCIHRLL
jgi:hypothetical protein